MLYAISLYTHIFLPNFKPVAVPEDSSCETGWLQFRQDKCYRFVHIRLAFDDAESLCNSLYGGHLPSIHSQEEQFMISQFLSSVNVKNGSEIWLGGRQMDFHNFNWADGSQFNYSYWEHGEPNFPAEKCIEMSWRNGRWNDISCRLKRAVLCERQVTSRHHIKPILYQPTTCLESNCSLPVTQTSPASSESSAPAPVTSASPLQEVLATNATSNQTNTNNQEPELLVKQASSGTVELSASMPNRSSLDTELHSLDESKPIRVITSILHRDRAPIATSPELAVLGVVLNSTLVQSAPITVSLEASSNVSSPQNASSSLPISHQVAQDAALDLVKRQQVIESIEPTNNQTQPSSLVEKILPASPQQIPLASKLPQNSPQVATNIANSSELNANKNTLATVKGINEATEKKLS